MLWQRMVIDQLSPSPRTGTSRWRQRRSRVGQESGAGLAGAKPCQHVGYLHFRSWPIEKASCPTADSCILYNGTFARLTDVMLLPAKAAKTLAKTCAAIVTLGAAFTPSNAQAVTTWNWSFSAGYGYSGSGTFTTSDVAPAANTTYQITGISGTFNPGEEAGYTITGLDTHYTNQFRWDGTSSSPILSSSGSPMLSSRGGIAFILDDGSVWLTQSIEGWNPITGIYDPYEGYPSILRSSLAPVGAPPTVVPGPLPLLGAAAAFQASRRLRRRWNGSRQIR
jgi:hypothetical protein